MEVQRETAGAERTIRSSGRPLVAGIGVSAGDRRVLQQFIRELPADCGLALVVVQQKRPRERALSVAAVSRMTALPVVALSRRVRPRANRVYLAGTDVLVTCERGALVPVPVSGRKRPGWIDPFFRSLAGDRGESAIGILLSAGGDGALGLRAIRRAGGKTMTRAFSPARGRKRSRRVLPAGAIDSRLELALMPAQLLAWAQLDRLTEQDGSRAGSGAVLERIFELLREETGQESQHYKRSTLLRRIEHRMQALRMHDAGSYLELLENDRRERGELSRNLLVGATSFFRDADALEALAGRVIARLLQGRESEDVVRVWVPGCATGEETYTIAILFHEALDELDQPPAVQIFATDFDQHAVATARRGRYPLSARRDLSPQRLARLFTRRSGELRVVEEVRELCLFSVHDLTTDPPFSQLDLIACRNLLMYLGAHEQKRLTSIFHYALRPNGYLFLGPSEDLAPSELFRSVDTRHRIWQRRPGPRPPETTPPWLARGRDAAEPVSPETDPGLCAQHLVLEEFMPAFAVVRDDGRIVFLSPGIEKYLQPPVGSFEGHVKRMSRSGLKAGLRVALMQAVRSGEKIVQHDLSIQTGEGAQRVRLTVRPMPPVDGESGFFLVVFQDVGPPLGRRGAGKGPRSSKSVVERLERELATAREQLKSTVQDLEAAIEELESSNEVAQTMNEELRSANEELQTSREEVQASNEALARADSDLSSLLQSTQIATLFLDEAGFLRDFTPAVKQVWNVIRSDIGRPLEHTTHRFRDMPPLPAHAVVQSSPAPIDEELQTVDGRWFIRRVSAYRTSAGEAHGTVVTFLDITALKEAERALRESEQRYRSMADSAPVLIWEAGTDKECTWFNQVWLDFTGRSLEQELGNGWAEGVHPDDMEHCLETYANAFDRRLPFEMEYRLRRHDGEWRWVVDRGAPRIGPDGVFLGYIGSCIDTTDHRRALGILQESEQHFREIADAMPAIAWTARPDGFRDYFNQRWFELTGTSRAVGGHQQWLTTLHDDDRERVLAAWRTAVQNGTPYEMECRYWVPSEGTYRWYLSRALPVRDEQGKLVRWVGTSTDIDQQKRLEAEREQLLGAERAARNELLRAAQLKDEFLATLSHELRTPLNAILGWAQILNGRAVSGPELYRGLEVIERNARAQARLISDLMDVNRIVSGRLRLDVKPLDPVQVIGAAVESLAPAAEEKQLVFEVELPEHGPVLSGDPGRLEQVAWNLISNAIKFTPPGGRVSVRLEQGVQHVRFSVQDTGSGIAPEFLPHIFERFRQGDPSITRRHGGLGLGLSIVRQLVELHGGRVWAESEGEGRGSTFTVELPVTLPSSPVETTAARSREDQSQAQAPFDLAGVRVLVVEDEADARELVGRVLEGAGAEVALVAAPEAALESLKDFEADVLVCDIGLPGQDGYQLLERLREMRERPIPALTFTAFSRPEDRERAGRAGFQDHIAKPLEPARLLAAVARLASRARE